VQPDQRQQARHLRLGRHQLVEQRGQPLGVVDEIAGLYLLGGGQVALVQQQVDHPEDLGQARAQLVVGGDPVGNARVGDLAFGAGDPLRHGRLGYQERSGDLGRGQPGSVVGAI
jgi:hypothetical protein